MKKKLKEIGYIGTGTTPSMKHSEFYDSEDIMFIKPSDFSNTEVTIINKTEAYLSNNARSKARLFPSGTVLCTCIGNIGKIALVAKEASCNQQNNYIIPNKDILPKFLAYSLLSQKEKMEIMGSNAPIVPIINKTEFSNIEIPFYESIEEQQKIATQLDKIQSAIDNKKQQLSLLDEAVKSEFVEMFGENPVESGKWKVSNYGNEFTITSGGTPSKSKPEYWKDGNIPWIGSNLCQNVVLTQNDGKYITEDGLTHSSAKLLPIGTVLVALVGATIGKTALLKFETTTNQNIAAIMVTEKKNKFLSEFIFYHMQSLYYNFMNFSNGEFSMANLSFIRKLNLPVPPLDLQNKFAAFVQQIDKSKFVVKQQIADLQELLDSKMQEYFS